MDRQGGISRRMSRRSWRLESLPSSVSMKGAIMVAVLVMKEIRGLFKRVRCEQMILLSRKVS